mmetsp:Transcript_33962/g.71439  ORF Transcript_33962/g.71439 Transcript_33962/m.71439 type:complete len:238 (-) Transcript_33962:138-851(-)
MSDEDKDWNTTEQFGQEEEVRSFRTLWDLLTRWATPSTIELVLGYQGKDYEHPAVRMDETTTINDPLDSSTEEEKTNEDFSTRNTVDIGASRLASIMSMLKMNLPRSLSELKKMHNQQRHSNATDPSPGQEEGATGGETIDQRKAEQRLADLARTFDSSAPAANLTTKLWRGLTTILIAISFPSLSALDSSGGGSNGSDVDGDAVVLPPSIRPLQMSAEEYRYLTRSAIGSLSNSSA